MTTSRAKEQHAIVFKNMVPRLVLLLVLTILVGVLGMTEFIRFKISPIEEAQVRSVSRSISMMNREIGYIRNLILLLKNSSEIRAGLALDREIDTALLQQFFIYFAESSNNVSQVRWIDMKGNERVRVNLVGQEASVVHEEDLQNKSDRYYFQKAIVAGDSVYISPIDLNIEGGTIVYPYEPTIRATILTQNSEGLQDGVLVMNFQLTDLFSDLRTMGNDRQHLEVLNSDGYWLLADNPELEWGFQLGHPDNNVRTLRPGVWHHMMQSYSSTGITADNSLVSYMFLSLDTNDGLVVSDLNRIIIAAVTDQGVLASVNRAVSIPFIAGCLLVYLVGFMIIRSLTVAEMDRQFYTQALQNEKEELQKALEKIKQSHERLGILQDELVEARKLSALGLIVAGVAHELNTPNGGALIAVSALQSQLNELKQNILEGLTQRQMEAFIENLEQGLQLAEKNLRRAGELISSFKRLAVDRNQEILVKFNLIECIRDLIHTVEPRLKDGRIKITVDLPDTLQLNSFPGIISQVLQNLIDNAIYHGFSDRESGIVSVSASLVHQGRQVCLHVVDNGKGIDPEIRTRIFDPFVTSGRGHGHTGLGLYLIHQWVHGVLKGSIKIEPNIGHGTCVTIILPVDIESSTSGSEALELTVSD
ncbi:sensor histidine kinase [Gynuella sunshinyii]|uniref:histidine kinase n=1 Tax=Gynuella sunshinyii YC6258 TaxID=1445510 RepID=A0A0C5VJ75_9GAMM|nr:ATP-binding protein [Gynuella sunshinyii]AJQ94697.1 signal transduction histidine kinase regulating C4-dicarboxylate transport system [Gynuella sunshinyii YC6258]